MCPEDELEDVGGVIAEAEDLEVLDLIDTAVTDLAGMRMFDVGQGDCIGILDQNQEVCCYIDYGGVNDHPDKRKPSYTRTRLPVQMSNGNFTPVILTHWDKDHYWSANKKNPDARKGLWLVPRQHVGPQAVKFASSLPYVYTWPEAIGSATVTFPVGSQCEIVVQKCDSFQATNLAQDRNLSGLAVYIRRQFADAGEEAGDEDDTRVMVLPGDCPFNRIPHFPPDPIKGLIAYHHGAKSHWVSQTGIKIGSQAAGHKVGFSYGKNSYGHPCKSNYLHAGWRHDAETRALRSAGSEFENFLW